MGVVSTLLLPQLEVEIRVFRLTSGDCLRKLSTSVILRYASLRIVGYTAATLPPETHFNFVVDTFIYNWL